MMIGMRRRLFLGALAGAAGVWGQEAADHEKFMRRAIGAAGNNRKAPYGAVIVETATGRILAEGWNQSALNPVWHGEIDAMNRCAAGHAGLDWGKTALYTTAEPCPMCQSAIAWAGIPLTVYGSSIPFLRGLGGWQIEIRAAEVMGKAAFRRGRVIGGVLETECNELFVAAQKLNGGGRRAMTWKAEGTFDVKMAAQKADNPQAEAAGLGRMSLDKVFHGELEGVSKGEMISLFTDKGSAGYVAIERVTGRLAGKSGGFALQHRGVMTRGVGELEVDVLPDSGTGELVGLWGKMGIRVEGGGHFYSLEYGFRG